MATKQNQGIQKLTDQALDLIAARFRILGEPARLRLLSALQGGEKTVSALVEETNLSQSNVSRHVQKLLESGILVRRKQGLNAFYSIADPGIFELCSAVCGGLRKDLAAKEKVLPR